ncbi:MAG: fused MFS/spermidine synthase [Pseudomonadaceae bacterium]|nr:fused MFS/spermidine synthase [Pseudomonadaceae bacterium]
MIHRTLINRPLVNLLAFTGGFVIMSVELLGGRMLAPYFGSSVYVWGSIITVFMASLSVGYLLGGQLSMRWVSLRVFASVFLIGSITLYPLSLAAESAMAWVFDTIVDPRYGSLTASLILFVVPTVILGIISPYSVRLLVGSAEESGRVAGTLYFVSTLGSAMGTLMTSFYFVLWFEINDVIRGLSGVLLLASIAAFVAAGRSGSRPQEEAQRS